MARLISTACAAPCTRRFWIRGFSSWARCVCAPFAPRPYAVADLLPQNGFIDMSFRIGVGRSDEEKRKTGEAIFATVTEFLAPLFATPHFALTLEIREIDPQLSWKKNAIHPRLRQKQA
ncbi:5-carboxymethyl-2-hydroxymuconate isomerase [Brucella ceti B1/94]|nr:5-carboxymethyl-2-hydroxymuconate isomerase [Brucella ceti B1/94]EEZ07282.1 5-carboxymethyl-2-hydroxymuconate isomerase [Brucella ceti M490/95/1]